LGKEEQKQREEEGSNVINHSYETDFTITRVINGRWSMGLTLPSTGFYPFFFV
jgi:hypothetical protein